MGAMEYPGRHLWFWYWEKHLYFWNTNSQSDAYDFGTEKEKTICTFLQIRLFVGDFYSSHLLFPVHFANECCCLNILYKLRACKLLFPDKNQPANAGDARAMPLAPGSGRFPGGGHHNSLWYSCLENPHGRRRLAEYSP